MRLPFNPVCVQKKYRTFTQWCKGKSSYLKLPIFFRSVTFFSPIWKSFSFSHISYLCLKVLYLERNFSRCTHQAHTVFYFQLWGIFKSAFLTKRAICAWCVHILFSHLRAWYANIICIYWCKIIGIASLLDGAPNTPKFLHLYFC